MINYCVDCGGFFCSKEIRHICPRCALLRLIRIFNECSKKLSEFYRRACMVDIPRKEKDDGETSG